MNYSELRDFISQLESRALLQRIDYPVSPYLEMTVVSDQSFVQKGPALLFTQVPGMTCRLLTNLFGTVSRVALAWGKNP